jgi:hypothetical protein
LALLIEGVWAQAMPATARPTMAQATKNGIKRRAMLLALPVMSTPPRLFCRTRAELFGCSRSSL